MKIKRFKEINEKFNLDNIIFSEIVDQLEDSYDWDYVEHEGTDRVRFDWGDNSLWVNKDNSFEGNAPNREVKMILKNRGLVSGLDEGYFDRYKDDDEKKPKSKKDDNSEIGYFDRYKDDDFDDRNTPHYNELMIELENVTKRFQVHLDAGDIKKALLEVIELYDDEISDKSWNR